MRKTSFHAQQRKKKKNGPHALGFSLFSFLFGSLVGAVRRLGSWGGSWRAVRCSESQSYGNMHGAAGSCSHFLFPRPCSFFLLTGAVNQPSTWNLAWSRERKAFWADRNEVGRSGNGFRFRRAFLQSFRWGLLVNFWGPRNGYQGRDSMGEKAEK